MRLRKAAGMILILVGSSGLALTALVIREPDPVDSYYEQDPLDPPAPSALDAWLMGMAFAGLTGAALRNSPNNAGDEINLEAAEAWQELRFVKIAQ